eukprot:6213753-Amphidinium_carterae.1
MKERVQSVNSDVNGKASGALLPQTLHALGLRVLDIGRRYLLAMRSCLGGTEETLPMRSLIMWSWWR